MSDNEFIEYKNLSDKAENETLSYEQLEKLNKLHIVFLNNCYDLALKNAAEQKEIQESLESIKQSLDEQEVINSLLASFIGESGLADEFKEFFDETVKRWDEEVEKNPIN